MARLDALKAKLDATPGWSDDPDWKVAEYLNKQDQDCKVKVRTAYITNYLARRQKLFALKSLLSSDNPTLREIGEGARMIIEGRWFEIDTDDPTVYTSYAMQISSIEQIGIINADEKNVMLAMTDGKRSWAELNGYGRVTAADVGHARINDLSYGE